MKKYLLCLVLILLMIGSFLVPTRAVKADDNDIYSIEYLLKNYGAVTLGKSQKNSYNTSRGNLHMADSYIEGAVLVGGPIDGYSSSFGSEAGNIKSFITGDIAEGITTSSEFEKNSNSIDFDKLYARVMNQSLDIARNAEYHINDYKIEINKPGNYVITNALLYWSGDGILINNYNPDELYIINYYDRNINALPKVYIIEKNSSNSIVLKDYIESGNYKSNIIFNLPNALNLYTTNGATIIAPNANVSLYTDVHSGTIIADSLSIANTNCNKSNYNLSNKISSYNSDYYEDAKDYNDDYYSRDYSIKDLLQNYSLVTLGHKPIDSKSKILEYGNTPGSVKLFHITGQALISGDLYGKVYNDQRDTYLYNLNKFDRVNFDLESNEVTESYVKGNVIKEVNYFESGSTQKRAISVIQPFDIRDNDNVNCYSSYYGNYYTYCPKKNSLYVGSINDYYSSYYYVGPGNYTSPLDNYINFERLYNNVVAEQSGIEAGKTLKVGEDGILHIPVGGVYTIEDISKVKEVLFDNFSDNKNKITLVTIKNSGDINFPLISKDNGAYKGIVTNDYFGKEKATHFYEADTFINEDSYYGNIVWNVPNATYIKLKEKAPFAGHLIAPNADVDTPETHFAGCFIVNSIYGEGNTEAHFYPLSSYETCDCSHASNVSSNLQYRLNDMRLSKLLGGRSSTIEKTIIGDQEKYNQETQLLNNTIDNCPLNNNSNQIVNIITNPNTYSTIGIVIGIIVLLGFGIKIVEKKKKNIN